MMKLNCIIDTCSCIYLSHAEFKQRNLLEHFRGKANLNYSNEVHLELRDHADKNLPTFIHESTRRISTKKYSMPEYERRMLGNVIPSRKKNGDKGEINNLFLSIDQIHHFKKNSIIFVTDDEKALNGRVFEWSESFPVVNVWTSYEVVLFLYAEKIIPSKDVANELVQDLLSFTAPKVNDRSPKTTQKIASMKKKYNQRIENISKLFN